MSTKVFTKSLSFCVDNDADWSNVKDNLLNFASTSGFSEACYIAPKRMVILHNEMNPVQFKSGMETVKNRLNLLVAPERVALKHPAPKNLIDQLIEEGLQEDDFQQVVGQKIKKMVQHAVVRGQVERKRTEAISHCSSGAEAASKGLVRHNEQINTQANLEFAKKRKLMDFREKLPKLTGSVNLSFRHYVNGLPDPDKPFETTIELKGLPEDLKTKKKHYWIYSAEAGYGKTYTVLNQIYKNYSSDVVGDPNNFCGVSENVQFLIFDEYSPRKRLNFETLKSLASQDATMVRINRKSHGDSYKPLNDVQVIILSNYSPYDVYGVYQPKENNRIVDKDLLSTIEERFLVYRLDGDVSEDKRKHMSPSLWSEEEFRTEIALKRREMMLGDDKLTETENFLKKVATLYRTRVADNQTLAGFRKLISDPNDWKVAQWMYSRRLKLIPEDKRQAFNEVFLADGPTFALEDVCSVEDIENALLRDESLSIVHLLAFLNQSVTDFDIFQFKKACKEKFIDVDPDELLAVVINCFLGVKKTS